MLCEKFDVRIVRGAWVCLLYAASGLLHGDPLKWASQIHGDLFVTFYPVTLFVIFCLSRAQWAHSFGPGDPGPLDPFIWARAQAHLGPFQGIHSGPGPGPIGPIHLGPF